MIAAARAVAASEARMREDTGIIWDGHMGRRCAFPPSLPDFPGEGMAPPAGAKAPAHGAFRPTQGATYAHDGSLEGILSAAFCAIGARDASADILPQGSLQPRLGQEVVAVEADMGRALIIRRCLEKAAGANAFRCVRAASAADDPDTGTVIYRFIRHALASGDALACRRCPQKRTCLRACSVPPASPLLDDLGAQPVFDLMSRYRAVMNERHLMEQFVRFEHCEGDVWFARCNPKASVVPLLMDWFVPRFNDQRFIIYDENHRMSGVYDGRRWYLVAGQEAMPPARTSDEPEMQRAWRRFYRSVSVESRYHPELRRNFMPMRLWRNLPELRDVPDETRV